MYLYSMNKGGKYQSVEWPNKFSKLKTERVENIPLFQIDGQRKEERRKGPYVCYYWPAQ